MGELVKLLRAAFHQEDDIKKADLFVASADRIAELEAEVANLKAIMRGDGGTTKVDIRVCPKCGKDSTGCNFIGCYGLAEEKI